MAGALCLDIVFICSIINLMNLLLHGDNNFSKVFLNHSILYGN